MADHVAQTDSFENSRFLRMVFRSTNDFAWDFESMDFSCGKFYCQNCTKTFFIDGQPLDSRECVCAGRGICGQCSPLSELKCQKCDFRGGCDILWRKDDRPIGGM